MHDRDLATCIAHLTHEFLQRLEVRFVESRHGTAGLLARATHDADAHLHRHWNGDRCPHRRNTLRNPGGLPHETCAECAASDPVTGAPAVEVDLIVSRLLPCYRGNRELLRIATPELQRHRMLLRIERQEAVGIAADDRRGGDHLRIKERPWGEATQEITAVAVGPVHHRRNAYFSVYFQSVIQ